jgi:hypothetical protein
VRSDPLNVLPYDTLLDIFDYLPDIDIASLMKASYHVNASTRSAAFWKHMLRLQRQPWLYELDSLALPEIFDYKGLFLWLASHTLPELGNHGPLMGIANRRRIWNTCQDLVSMYKDRLRAVSSDPEINQESHEAKAILANSMCSHMPMTMYPQPEHPVDISAQFIRSWNEITHRSCDFETYWRSMSGSQSSDSLALVGVAVIFRGHKRVFGSDQGCKERRLHIKADEWIQEITVDVSAVDLVAPEHPNPNRTTYINGLSVSYFVGP